MNERINEKIGAWLIKDGNTRSVLADELGMSRPTLNSRLTGKSCWLWDEVVAISKLTGCSLNELAEIPN